MDGSKFRLNSWDSDSRIEFRFSSNIVDSWILLISTMIAVIDRIYF